MLWLFICRGYLGEAQNPWTLPHQRSFLWVHFQVLALMLSHRRKEKFADYENVKAAESPLDGIRWFLDFICTLADFGAIIFFFILSHCSHCWPLWVLVRNKAIIRNLYLFITSNTILRLVLTDSHFFFPVAPGNSNSISIMGYWPEGYFCPLIPLRQIWSDMLRSLAFWCLNKLCRHLLPKDFGGFTPSVRCRIDRDLQTMACNE